jgi:hypothetical protein
MEKINSHLYCQIYSTSHVEVAYRGLHLGFTDFHGSVAAGMSTSLLADGTGGTLLAREAIEGDILPLVGGEAITY